MKRLKSLIFVSLVWTVVAVIDTSDQKKIVCYFDSWALYRTDNAQFNIDDIDPSLCTHLIYAFIGLSASDIRVRDPYIDLPDNNGKDGYRRFLGIREKNPTLKIMVAVGGGDEGSEPFSRMAKTPESRDKFADNALEFVKKYKFDGLDVDWEYPAQRGGDKVDYENFIHLLRALKTRFEREGLILSAAVETTSYTASISYNIPEMVKNLDFINLMTYDFYGWGNKIGIHGNLYNSEGNSVKAAIDLWMNQGAPKEKLVVGVPTYGRSFTLINPESNYIGAPVKGEGLPGPYIKARGVLGYNEICDMLSKDQGWQVVRDSERHAPYAFKGDQWFGYDDAQTAQEKAEFIKQMGLSGAMVWTLGLDDFKGMCGPKYPIIRALSDVLRA